MDPKESLWFLMRGGSQVGPLLGRSITDKDLSPDTLVWCEGLPNWTPASETPLGDLVFGAPPDIPQPPGIPVPPPVAVPPAPTAKPEPLWSHLPTIPRPDAPPSSADPTWVPPPLPYSSPVPPSLGAEAVPVAVAMRKASNYFVRHWRGELPLWLTYWINTFAVSVVLALMVGLLVELDMSLKALSALCLTIFAVSLIMLIWQATGLCRCLLRRHGSGASPTYTVLGWFAFVVMCIVSISTAVTTIIPQSREYLEIVAGDKDMPEMRLLLLPSGKEVEISGGLRAGCAQEFREFIERTPSIKVVHVNSIGGRISEGLEIAKIVADREMTTYVSNSCASAATLIFLSGRERFVNEEAKVGFHAGYFPGVDKETIDVKSGVMADHMKSAGVSADFITKALGTSHDQMWYPTLQEMLDAGVVTGRSYGESFGISSSLAKSIAGDNLEALFKEYPHMLLLKNEEPEVYGEILATLRAAAKEGLTLAEISSQTRPIVGKVYLQYLRYAGDEALMVYLDFCLFMVDRYGANYPDELLRYFLGTPNANGNFAFQLPDYPYKLDFAMMDVVFESGRGKITRPINTEKAEADLSKVAAAMYEKSPELTASFIVFRGSETTVSSVDRLKGFAFYIKTLKSEMDTAAAANIVRYDLSGTRDE